MGHGRNNLYKSCEMNLSVRPVNQSVRPNDPVRDIVTHVLADVLVTACDSVWIIISNRSCLKIAHREARSCVSGGLDFIEFTEETADKRIYNFSDTNSGRLALGSYSTILNDRFYMQYSVTFRFVTSLQLVYCTYISHLIRSYNTTYMRHVG